MPGCDPFPGAFACHGFELGVGWVGCRYIHYKGIVHRDCNPKNFMLTTDGKVKIGDFGMAQA